MPIMTIHLKKDSYSDAQCEALMLDVAQRYAEILECPIDRTRILIDEIPGQRMMVGGRLQTASDSHGAPFFEFFMLAGRPREQHERMHAETTAALVKHLGVDARLIRGCCYELPPTHWSIGGELASVKRAAEVVARASS